jgi:endonuclease YncB( thermonuclease family)
MFPPEVPASPVVGPEGWHRVESIVDADAVRLVGLERPVDLAGVDGPADGERCGPEARALLAELAAPGSHVYLEVAEVGLTPDGRWHRAYLRVPHLDELWTLQELMLADGVTRLASQPDDRTTRYPGEFAEAEERGRRAGHGLWSPTCELARPALRLLAPS